jgi:hypothetical protein
MTPLNCDHSARSYILSIGPKSPGKCDEDCEGLIVRIDDQESVFRERMKAYDEQMRPIPHQPSGAVRPELRLRRCATGIVG